MRDLLWSGGYNIRDLGGLRTADGGATVSGRVVRSAMPDRLTERGWASLVDYGVRTIIDLRDEGEDPEPLIPRPDAVTLVPVPIDTIAGQEWFRSVRHLDGTPRIFARYLADVEPAAIAEDYLLSYDRQRVAYTALGKDRMPADLDLIGRMLAEAGVTGREAMLAVLEGCDIRETLSAAGVTAVELDAVTARLRES